MSLLSKIDHLVYAASNLEKGIKEIETLTGAKVHPGGVHRGRGTHNALLSLGPGCYLEIIAPDPLQKKMEGPLWMGLDELKESRLTRWATKCSDISKIHKKATQANLWIGEVQEGQRNLPDGQLLQWQLSDPKACQYNGLIPFFIDWQKSLHPEENLPKECELISFTAKHPEAVTISDTLNKFDLLLSIEESSTIGFNARIRSPKGVIVLT